MLKTNCLAVLLFAAALVLPANARAQEGADEEVLPYLHLGPVIVHPSLTLEETWTDNVFYSAQNVQSDFITSVVPGISLNLPFSRNEVSLAAMADIEQHAEYTSEDKAPYQGDVKGTFFFGDRVNLFAGDTYRRDYETPNESPSGRLEENTVNTLAASLKYAFVDVAQFQLDCSWASLDYPESDYRTRDERLAAVYLYYKVLPATSAFVEYDYKQVDYAHNQPMDGDIQWGYVGAVWQMTEHSRGTVKAGFLAKDFDDEGKEDFSTWAASVDLRHQLNDFTSVSLAGKRDVNEGKYTYTRYYLTTSATAELTYAFLDRLAGMIRVSYGIDQYSDPVPGTITKREDKTGSGGVGLLYKFNSWLDVKLFYTYSDRDSNIENESVSYHTVNFAITGYR